jgi:hypothetical protein
MKILNIWLFLIVIAAGYLFQFLIAVNAPRAIFGDMTSYHEYAIAFTQGKYQGICCNKNPGYGVFLGVIYRFFGPGHPEALIAIQTGLNILSALLVYLASGKILGEKPATGALFLGLFNPLTAAYAGYRLSETVTLSLISWLVFLYSHLRTDKFRFGWLAVGFVSGLILFVRMQFYYFAAASYLLPLLFVRSFNNKLKYTALAATFFIIANLYSLTVNYHDFRAVSFNAPYHAFYGALYSNFFNDFRYPELTRDFDALNMDYSAVALEFFQTPYQNLHEFEAKYRQLFLQRIPNDWPAFLTNTLRNFVWMWDKYFLYVYEDKFLPYSAVIARITNLIFLVFGTVGIVGYRKSGGQGRKLLLALTLVLFVYISTMFTLVSNESRHALPFYPLLTFWAGGGINLFFNRIRCGGKLNPDTT